MHHVGWPWSWTGALQGGVAPTPSQVYGKAGKPTPCKSHILDSDPMEEQRVQRWTNTIVEANFCFYCATAGYSTMHRHSKFPAS